MTGPLLPLPLSPDFAETLLQCQSSFFIKDSPWPTAELATFICAKWIIPGFSIQHPRTAYYTLRAGEEAPDGKAFRDRLVAPRSVFYDAERAAEAIRRGPFHGILASADWEPTTGELPWISGSSGGSGYAGTLIPVAIPNCDTHRVWLWQSVFPKRRALAIDMHMVPMDAQAVLAAFNVHVDFYFTSDVADILMNAYHSEFFEFKNTSDILGRDYTKPLSEELVRHVRNHGYEFIITGHTLYTTLVFSQLGLPMLHVNSTRYANEYVSHPSAMTFINAGITELLRSGRLTIFHNNRVDEAYFNWYFPWFRKVWPGRCLHVPSLCEYGPRLRVRTPAGPRRYMFWDPRNQTLEGKSPYLSKLWRALKERLGDRIERTYEIKNGAPHIPDGFQDKYAAIIHIPYNASTMSMFEQSRAGIPTWVPSRSLLEALWNLPTEHNELSWYAFSRDKLANAPWPERIDKPAVVAAYVARTDWCSSSGSSSSSKPILGGVLEFNSAADLVDRIDTTDYDTVIAHSHATYPQKRANIYAAYRDFLRHLE